MLFDRENPKSYSNTRSGEMQTKKRKHSRLHCTHTSPSVVGITQCFVIGAATRVFIFSPKIFTFVECRATVARRSRQTRSPLHETSDACRENVRGNDLCNAFYAFSYVQRSFARTKKHSSRYVSDFWFRATFLRSSAHKFNCCTLPIEFI